MTAIAEAEMELLLDAWNALGDALEGQNSERVWTTLRRLERESPSGVMRAAARRWRRLEARSDTDLEKVQRRRIRIFKALRTLIDAAAR